jgi:hypothetical protein
MGLTFLIGNNSILQEWGKQSREAQSISQEVTAVLLVFFFTNGRDQLSLYVERATTYAALARLRKGAVVHRMMLSNCCTT